MTTLAEASSMLKEIKKRLSEQNISMEVYFVLANLIGRQFVESLAEDQRHPRFEKFLEEQKLETQKQDNQPDNLKNVVNDVGNLFSAGEERARAKIISNLITEVRKNLDELPAYLKKQHFTGCTRLHSLDQGADKVLECVRMMNNMRSDVHKKKYTDRTKNFSWIRRKFFMPGIPATRGALQKKLSNLQDEIKKNKIENLDDLKNFTEQLYQLQKYRFQYCEAFKGNEKSEKVYDNEIVKLQEKLKEKLAESKESILSYGKILDDITEQNIIIAELRDNDDKVTKKKAERLFFAKDLSLVKHSLSKEKIETYPTSMERINNVLGNEDPQIEVAQEMRARYTKYKQSLQEGVAPNMPGFYHATTLDKLKSIMKEGKISASKDELRGGVWTSTIPELDQFININKEDKQELFNCGIAFSKDMQWSNDLGRFMKNKKRVAEVRVNKENQRTHLWVSFDKDIDIVIKDKINPNISFIFFDTEENYRKFVESMKDYPCILKIPCVIGKECLMAEAQLNSLHQTIPADISLPQHNTKL